MREQQFAPQARALEAAPSRHNRVTNVRPAGRTPERALEAARLQLPSGNQCTARRRCPRREPLRPRRHYSIVGTNARTAVRAQERAP